MSEPHAASGLAIGASISPTALLFGAQVNLLVAGLFAAILVSIWLDTIDNKLKAAAAVLFSALIAAYGSPVVTEYIVSNVSGITSSDSLRILIALLLGALSPTAVPIAIGAFGDKVKGDRS